jgi:hypothetical protein
VQLTGSLLEEAIDRQVEASVLLLGEPQRVPLEPEVAPGRDQIDVPRPEQHAVGDRVDGQLGVSSQQVLHQRLVIRGEVLDHDEGGGHRGRQRAEEALEGLEPTGGCADRGDLDPRSDFFGHGAALLRQVERGQHGCICRWGWTRWAGLR